MPTTAPNTPQGSRGEGSPSTPRGNWLLLTGGLVVAGSGAFFLLIGYGWTLVSAVQLGVGAWMAIDGWRGLS